MRVLPDSNDVAVWMLNEASGDMLNSSTSGSSLGADATLLASTVTGTITRGAMGVFMPPSDSALSFPGFSTFPAGASSTQNRIRTNGGLTSLNVPLPITVSGWVKVRHPLGSVQAIVNKTYLNNMASWVDPFATWGMYVGTNNGASSTDGSWEVFLTTAGVVRRLTMPGTTTVATRIPPRAVWSHMGLSYDGAFLKAWLNGEQAGSLAVTGAIDYGTNGPIIFGCVPTLKQEITGVLQDWRLANVARPLEYFQDIYASARLIL